jgi:anti-sigma B factor antagonist
MTICEQALDDVAILLVYGRLDIASADALGRAVDRLLRFQWRKLLLNLADVDEIDAAGLGALAHIHSMARVVSASVKLAHLTPPVREALDRTGLMAVFDVYMSQAEALASFEMFVLN